MKLFIFLLIINLIIVLIYLIWNHIRRKERLGSVWMKAVMMLLCPVVGPMFVLLSFLLFKLFSSQGMDLSDVVFNKDRTENFLRPDEDRNDLRRKNPAAAEAQHRSQRDRRQAITIDQFDRFRILLPHGITHQRLAALRNAHKRHQHQIIDIRHHGVADDAGGSDNG